MENRKSEAGEEGTAYAKAHLETLQLGDPPAPNMYTYTTGVGGRAGLGWAEAGESGG